jgi:hypothetical protein
MSRFRDDLRDYFEREAHVYPVPNGLRSQVIAQARPRVGERHAPSWLAAAIAVVLSLAIVGGLLAAGNLHRLSTKPASTAPKLLFHDQLTGVTKGRPFLPAPIGPTLTISSYLLESNLPGNPGQGTVYAVNPAIGPSALAVGKAFGVTTLPTFADGQYLFPPGSLTYVPATGTVAYTRPSRSVRIDEPGYFPRPITNSTAAISMAADFLVAHGMFSRPELSAMPATATHINYPGNIPLWSIHFLRTLAAPSDRLWTGAGAWLQVNDNQQINSVIVARSPISGSLAVQLIDAASAWHEIALGHAYSSAGLGNPQVTSFRADSVQLCYLEGGSWLIPMWCFTDTTTQGADFPISLFYPAAQPGTFDWSLPTPPASNTLQLHGPLTTDSSKEIVGSGRGCGFGPPLQFETNAMTLADGQVVRVAFTIAAQASSGGSYGATAPLQQYGYTPLTVAVGRNATVGAGNTINATSGAVTVAYADAASGLFYGSVNANFSDGTVLSGGWLCRVGQ